MPPVEILYRWRGRCGLEGILVGVRRAVVLGVLVMLCPLGRRPNGHCLGDKGVVKFVGKNILLI